MVVTLVGFLFLLLVCFSWVGGQTLLASKIILPKYLPTSSHIKPNLHSFSIEGTGRCPTAPTVTFCDSLQPEPSKFEDIPAQGMPDHSGQFLQQYRLGFWGLFRNSELPCGKYNPPTATQERK